MIDSADNMGERVPKNSGLGESSPLGSGMMNDLLPQVETQREKISRISASCWPLGHPFCLPSQDANNSSAYRRLKPKLWDYVKKMEYPWEAWASRANAVSMLSPRNAEVSLRTGITVMRCSLLFRAVHIYFCMVVHPSLYLSTP